MIDESRIRNLFNEALELSRCGRSAEARELYDRITDSYPRLFGAWFNKAVICEQLHDVEGAIDCYYRAVDLEPNHEGATRGLAIMLFNGRQFRKARYWIEKAIRNGDPHPALPLLLRCCLGGTSGTQLVFVSYSWADRERVDGQILPFLRTEGIEYFIDRNRIPQQEQMPSLRWQLEVGVAQCDTLLLAWSAAARGSHFVSSELCLALAMMRNVIVVTLEAAEQPPWLEGAAARGVVAAVPAGPELLQALRACAENRVYDRVTKANRHATTLTEEVLGASFDLIPLNGGLLSDFAIGKYPVTQAQWSAVMGTNPSANHGDPTRPVENVTWHETQEFLRRLGAASGRLYRLPNEAEWEFACRAGSRGNWCFGDDESKLHEYAWYQDNTEIGSAPSVTNFAIDGVVQGAMETSPYTTNSVFTKKPNDWGIYHMHGNVSEWCSDSVEGRQEMKRIRGGAYNSSPRNLRCASRGMFEASRRDSDVGFRLCRSR